MSTDGFPEGVTWLSTCPNCHFEKLDYPGGWRWRCDDYHPEVIAQMEAWQAACSRKRNDDDEFWRKNNV